MYSTATTQMIIAMIRMPMTTPATCPPLSLLFPLPPSPAGKDQRVLGKIPNAPPRLHPKNSQKQKPPLTSARLAHDCEAGIAGILIKHTILVLAVALRANSLYNKLTVSSCSNWSLLTTSCIAARAWAEVMELDCHTTSTSTVTLVARRRDATFVMVTVMSLGLTFSIVAKIWPTEFFTAVCGVAGSYEKRIITNTESLLPASLEAESEIVLGPDVVVELEVELAAAMELPPPGVVVWAAAVVDGALGLEGSVESEGWTEASEGWTELSEGFRVDSEG